jgi:hypothetical protein
VLSRLSLSQRVFASSSAAMLLVVVAFAIVAHHSLQRTARQWAREDLAALGHHVAEMVLAAPAEERRQVVSRLASQLLAFDVAVSVRDDGFRSPDGSSVLLPLGPGQGELELRRSQPAGVELARRLTRLNLLLGGAALAALLVAVQSSTYWGLVRPLRAVRNQLRLMRRGPWRVPASADAGVPEMVELARDVEEVGAVLDQKVSEWVAAERRAAEELASRRLRGAALPPVRMINLTASDLVARGGLDDQQLRSLRCVVRAGEELLASLAPGGEDAAPERSAALLRPRALPLDDSPIERGGSGRRARAAGAEREEP